MIVRCLFVLLLFVAPQIAFAQPFPPPIAGVRIEPAAPVAGQLVRVVVDYFGCASPVVGSDVVTRNGSTITFSPLVEEFPCGVPPPSLPFPSDLGTFQPGSYTLVYAPRSTFPGATYQQLIRGFTVGVASVPVLRPAGIAVLGLAMLAVTWRLRRLAVSATRSRR